MHRRRDAAAAEEQAANEIVKKLLVKYEDRLADPPRGKKFQECYDWDSIEPCQEYIDLYGRIKEELTGYGLKFNQGREKKNDQLL